MIYTRNRKCPKHEELSRDAQNSKRLRLRISRSMTSPSQNLLSLQVIFRGILSSHRKVGTSVDTQHTLFHLISIDSRKNEDTKSNYSRHFGSSSDFNCLPSACCGSLQWRGKCGRNDPKAGMTEAIPASILTTRSVK